MSDYRPDVRLFTSSTEFLLAAEAALCKREGPANIIYSNALKRRADEDQGISNPARDFWLLCSSPNVQFIVAVTSGPLGKTEPVYIYSTMHSDELSSIKDIVTESLKQLAKYLARYVQSYRRVFALFGPEMLIKRLKHEWLALHPSLQAITEPYYDATFTHCTPATLKQVKPKVSDTLIRKAANFDIPRLTPMLLQFANGDPPMPGEAPEEPTYRLRQDDARRQAQILINGDNLWILEAQHSDGSRSIESILATARRSGRVLSVTKVFTKPTSRGKGHAAVLLRYVCEHAFRELHKDYVVLYVGLGLKAEYTYKKVGFVGLLGDQAYGAERMLEVGFKDTDKGCW